MGTRQKPDPDVRLSQAVIDEFCARIAAGESMRSICKLKSMPSWKSVCRWLHAGQTEDGSELARAFRQRYARAREEQADLLAEEALDAARGANARNANAKRLLVDTIKWRAGKLKPKAYGDKVEVGVSQGDGGPVQSHMTVTFVRPKADA